MCPSEAADEDEELGPVARALLDALKESGADDLIRYADVHPRTRELLDLAKARTKKIISDAVHEGPKDVSSLCRLVEADPLIAAYVDEITNSDPLFAAAETSEQWGALDIAMWTEIYRGTDFDNVASPSWAVGMRIVVDRYVGEDVPHEITTTRQWKSLEEAVASYVGSVERLGGTALITPGTGDMSSITVSIYCSHPPMSIALFDADGYETKFGYAAEGTIRFYTTHHVLLDAIENPKGAHWERKWSAIEKQIRDHDVMSVELNGVPRSAKHLGVISIPVPVWNVLVAVRGVSLPVLVCDCLYEPVIAPCDRLLSAPLPIPCERFIYIPWHLFRAPAMRQGVLIGRPLA